MGLARSFAQSSFSGFINSPAGRVARIVVGLILIAVGYGMDGRAAGIVLIVIGLVPLVAGALNLCLMSALLGGPISGARIARDRSNT